MNPLTARTQFYSELLGEAALRGPEVLIEARRRLVLEDLFYLMVGVLKRTDLVHPWIMARCDEVNENRDGYLDLWSREHGKTSIVTVGLSIQEVLRDPETTIGIFSCTRPLAKNPLFVIKNELHRNEDLKSLFPDILWQDPEKESPMWSMDTGLIVKRRGNPREATFEAWGLIDAMPTGKHFMVSVYDDIIDRRAVTSPDMIAKATEAWELSLSLNQIGGRFRYAGTRYHANDPYAEIMRRGSAKPRIYPATSDGTVDGPPVFMTREELDKRRRDMGSYTFACQMLQNPLADSKQGFKYEWLRWYDETEAGAINKYIVVDPASEKKKTSDYTVMAVVGLGPDQNYYLLDLVRDRLNLKERADALFELHRRWRPLAVGYEKYGAQCDIEYIREVQARESYRFDITPLGGSMAKNDRIKRLVPIMETGAFYLPHSLHKFNYEGKQQDLVAALINEELLSFPVSHHDDMMDAISRILDPDLPTVWPKGTSSRPKPDRYAKGRSRPRLVSWMVA